MLKLAVTQSWDKIICAKYGMVKIKIRMIKIELYWSCLENSENPGSKWMKYPKVVGKDLAKILWHFQINTNNVAVANQPDIMEGNRVGDRVIDIPIPSDSNITLTHNPDP